MFYLVEDTWGILLRCSHLIVALDVGRSKWLGRVPEM